jgi:hypothetical protein
MKQGTPGKPFPEDVELRDRARDHAAVARPGSRAEVFWALMVRAAESEIRTSLERDRELEEGDA